jgi:hypothetical protein
VWVSQERVAFSGILNIISYGQTLMEGRIICELRWGIQGMGQDSPGIGLSPLFYTSVGLLAASWHFIHLQG